MAVDPGIATVVTPTADGLVHVTLTGALTPQSVVTVRNTLLKCLTDDPVAVVVDVRALHVPQLALLTVFPTVLIGHGDPAAIALIAPAAVLASWTVSRVLGMVTVHGTLAEARAHLLVAPARRHRMLRLPPDPASSRTARRFVAAACTDWELAQLTESATMVVSELVSNAVEHAGTPIRVTVYHRRPYLYVAVHDGAPDSRIPASGRDQIDSNAVRGRGLYLVDVYATARGVTRTVVGKNVWVSLRASPVTIPAGAGPATD